MVSNLITVWLLWFIIMVAVWLIRIVLCKGCHDLETEDHATAKIKLIKAIVNLISLLLFIAAIIVSLIFVLFIREKQNRPVSEQALIHQAPLPKEFKEPTKQEIKMLNRETLKKKMERVEEEAKKANNAAVNEAEKFFKSKK